MPLVRRFCLYRTDVYCFGTVRRYQPYVIIGALPNQPALAFRRPLKSTRKQIDVMKTDLLKKVAKTDADIFDEENFIFKPNSSNVCLFLKCGARPSVYVSLLLSLSVSLSLTHSVSFFLLLCLTGVLIRLLFLFCYLCNVISLSH